MNELKPCPFCNTMPDTKVFSYAGKTEFLVACKKCGTRQSTRWNNPCISMNFRDVQALMDTAIEKWNRRAQMENEEMMDKTLYLMVYHSLPEESKKAISELWDTGINNSDVWVRFENVEATIGKVIWPFRNYTVDMEVLKQVQWERDIAIDQLREIGKSLGEKMDDIVKVKHAPPKPDTSLRREG